MKQITIDLTLSAAREWYKGGNEYLRKMALTAYSIEDLTGWPTTLEDAAKKAYYDIRAFLSGYSDIRVLDKQAASILLINTVIKAMLGKEVNTKKYYPKYIIMEPHHKPVAPLKYMGRVKIEGVQRDIYSYISFLNSDDNRLLFGCNTEEQASHLNKHFWKNILRVLYGKDISFEE